MPFIDTIDLFLSFLVAALLCCMLAAYFRLSASLRFTPAKASSPLPQIRTATRPRAYYGYLSAQPHSTSAMFKRAVKSHNAAAPSQLPASRQQSLTNSFKRPNNAQKSSAYPLSTLSGNITKHNAAAERRTPGHAHGTKRTSSGLAKALSSQKEAFDYPPLNVSDYENDLPGAFHTTMGSNQAPQIPVFFDEDDFDSDIDLDVEDPATKSTVSYPTLPAVGTAASRDSAYQSVTPKASQKQVPSSSQPIPWSSSPPEHFETPPKAQNAVLRTKRRTLPWQQKAGQVKTESSERIEDEPGEEPETVRPKKRRSAEAAPTVNSTPLPRSSKPEYPWNTTASALKLQQKELREANKKIKANEGTEEDMKAAISKKKKTTIHRIFLSEEQQHVLNLVVEYKKSVFFTGSAGMWLRHSVCTLC